MGKILTGVIAVFFFVLTGIAYGANVALFADTAYVDYSPGDPDSEASNLQATLESLGHTVTTFTGITTGAWTAALAGANVLAIPEQEAGAIFPDLEAGAVTAIQNFVNSGKGLIIFEDYYDFLNSVFGFSIATGSDSPPWTITTAAVGTPFEGGPASLPDLSATDDFISLPSGTQCMYESGSGCIVFVSSYGAGRIASLGWDWYNAAPVGTEDSGWVNVLGRAMTYITQTAKTAKTAIPTINEWGMIIFMVLAGLGAVYYMRRQRRA